MTSSPLFIKVAESTDILRPMLHLGCAHACCGDMCGSNDASVVRNGPPDAVKMTFVTPRAASPGRYVAGMH